MNMGKIKRMDHFIYTKNTINHYQCTTEKLCCKSLMDWHCNSVAFSFAKYSVQYY